MMVKISVDKFETYPDYSFSRVDEDSDEFEKRTAVEVPSELLEEYELALEILNDVKEKLLEASGEREWR